MRSKATQDLVQLTDADFFKELAHGMRAVMKNAYSLVDDARILADAHRHRSAELLLVVAEEEAAKYHILLDAARCERQGGNLARQLKRFNDHLAKGIYAEYVGIAPASFGEVLAFLERERRSLYLDGPNDVDWIFRNRILQGREEIFYVDYVEADGVHLWIEPGISRGFGERSHVPDSVRLAAALSEAGFDDPAALQVIAEVWRGVRFHPEDHWQVCEERNIKTLQLLNERGLLTGKGTENAGQLAWDWLFPLHSVDLSQIKVERMDLETIQQSWNPGY